MRASRAAALACLLAACSTSSDVVVVCGSDAGLTDAMAAAAGRPWTADVTDSRVVVTSSGGHTTMHLEFSADRTCPDIKHATVTAPLPTVREDGPRDYDAMVETTLEIEAGEVSIQDWNLAGAVSGRVIATEPLAIETWFWAEVNLD